MKSLNKDPKDNKLHEIQFKSDDKEEIYERLYCCGGFMRKA